jgi:bis(5'-nucleosyl)-tetraphosphatase (symmetrical)
MAIYAIGDVQGCYDELRALLDRLRFDPDRDRLWLVGDLVNRGPRSLATLRFVKGLGERAVAVLGNHDLHLLALVAGNAERRRSDPGLAAVLRAPDRDELIEWLRHRPLLHSEPSIGASMVHAGLPPQWDLTTARACAQELESVLRGDRWRTFFDYMYGNEPSLWNPNLTGWDRLRFITNAFTRLRFVDADGRLRLDAKGPPTMDRDGLTPWFRVAGRASAGETIIFGHWSTLGFHRHGGSACIDTGCVWGGSLTAVRVDAAPVPISHDCPGAATPKGD